MNEEPPTQYLAVKNWSKFQPANKNGKRSREWIRLECNFEDHAELRHLNLGEYALLTTIWRIMGRTGRNVPYDAHWLRMRLPSGKHTTRIVLAWLQHIISIGLLVLTNQQEIENFLPVSSTGRNVTRHKEEPSIYVPPLKEKPQKQKAKTFEKPTIDEVQTYMLEIGFADSSTVEEKSSYWLDHYESQGWMIGKKKMVDWKASVRTWKHREFEFSPPGKNGNGNHAPAPAAPKYAPGQTKQGMQSDGLWYDSPRAYRDAMLKEAGLEIPPEEDSPF